MYLRGLQVIIYGISFMLSCISFATFAHRANEPEHQIYHEGNLPLENGAFIRVFSLSYTTFGTLNKDKSNAILMVTAIGGNHHRLDYLIGPGKALDPDKYFIICTDAIGNAPDSTVEEFGSFKVSSLCIVFKDFEFFLRLLRNFFRPFIQLLPYASSRVRRINNSF